MTLPKVTTKNDPPSQPGSFATLYEDGVPIVRTMDFHKQMHMAALQLSAVPAILQHRRLAHTTGLIVWTSV
jgi:hypothetical protein